MLLMSYNSNPIVWSRHLQSTTSQSHRVYRCPKYQHQPLKCLDVHPRYLLTVWYQQPHFISHICFASPAFSSSDPFPIVSVPSIHMIELISFTFAHVHDFLFSYHPTQAAVHSHTPPTLFHLLPILSGIVAAVWISTLVYPLLHSINHSTNEFKFIQVIGTKTPQSTAILPYKT